MRFILAALLLAPGSPAFAQTDPAGAEGQGPDIVVTARINDAREALEACLARNCPPDEDIDATLGLAEALFETGDYQNARRTIADSMRRNRDAAASYPEPVADLHRAGGRVARHMGLDAEARRAVHGILESLQRGIPQEDHRHFGARLEISEILVAQGRYAGARRELERLKREAERAGRADVAAIAEMRSLWIGYIANPQGDSKARLIQLSRSTDPEQRIMQVAARLLLARIYREEGDTAASDAMIAEIGRSSGGRRRLIYSPPYEMTVRELAPTEGVVSANVTSRISDNFEDTWIDVGFWVQPDGSVSELEIVRQGTRDTSWAAPLLTSIRGRRYSPATEPTYRLERYTYTADLERQTGSMLQRRSPRARVEYMDLTEQEQPAEGPGAGE